MALKKNFTIKVYGKDVEFCDAYIKVVRIHGDKRLMAADVEIFTEPGGERLHHTSYAFPFEIEGSNVIAQAYAHIKTLPEFFGAVDC